MNPLVSVITAVKNNEQYIKRCVDSVSSQTYKNIEHILVLGNSEDSTNKILRQMRRRNKQIKIIEGPIEGIYPAINVGIVNSKGKFLIILGSDDWLVPHGIQMLLDKIKKTKADFAVGQSIVFNRVDGSFIKVIPVTYDARVLVNGWNPFCHQAMLASRRCYATCGLYDETFFVSSDYKWIRSLYTSKLKMGVVNKPVVHFASGGFSETHKDLGFSESKLIVQDHYKQYSKEIGAFIEYLHGVDKLRVNEIQTIINQNTDINFLKAISLNLTLMLSKF
jgi:glycosyltransferase involved in cell wall biosynthesis